MDQIYAEINSLTKELDELEKYMEDHSPGAWVAWERREWVIDTLIGLYDQVVGFPPVP